MPTCIYRLSRHTYGDGWSPGNPRIKRVHLYSVKLQCIAGTLQQRASILDLESIAATAADHGNDINRLMWALQRTGHWKVQI